MAANFSLPSRPQSGSNDGARAVENVGNIPLRIEEFDTRKNAATGVNTLTGEVETIYMVTKEEFAKLYVNGSRFTNDKARMDEAERQIKNQPQIRKMAADAITPDTVIQFQSVKRLNNEGGRMVARWANAVTTDAEREFSTRAEVNVSVVPARNGGEERRRITAYMMDDTVAATRDSVGDAFSGRLRADAGSDPFGESRIGRPMLIVVSDPDGKVDSATVFPIWDAQAQDFKKGVEAAFEREVGRFDVIPMAALAARIGMPVESVKFAVDDNSKFAIRPADVAEFEKVRQSVFEAAQRGELAVTVTPGVQTQTMKHLKESLMKGEQDARQNNLTARGFWTADLSLQANPENTGNDGRVFPPQWQVKEARPAEFLVSHQTPDFVNRTLRDLGEKAVVVASQKGELVFAPMPGMQVGRQAEQKRDREQEAERDSYVPSGASMDMD